MCALVAAAAAAGRRRGVAASFLAGRFAGVFTLGMVIAVLGWYVDISSKWLLLVFAVATIAFGAAVLVWPAVLRRRAAAGGCGSNGCSECGAHAGHDCGACSQAHSCPSRAADGSMTAAAVGTLGFIRGATPCIKIMLLAPLLLTLPLWQSAAAAAVFAASSTVYPLIGILLISIAGTVAQERWSRHLTGAGAAAMVCIGTYYLYKFIVHSCPGGL